MPQPFNQAEFDSHFQQLCKLSPKEQTTYLKNNCPEASLREALRNKLDSLDELVLVDDDQFLDDPAATVLGESVPQEDTSLSPVRGSVSSDRNLLIGLLAVQKNLVTQKQLWSALETWSAGKDKTLGEIFCEQNWISQEQADELTREIEQQIESHNGDIAASLEALHSEVKIHFNLDSVTDEDLLTSLSKLEMQQTFLTPNEYPEAAPRPTLQGSNERYRILRPHARGGLGEVFLAQDLEIERQVALKQIQDEFADQNLMRTRFLREAEVTGALEHPGIVPVYGMGTNNQGRPFYTMRFIQGDSLKEALQEFHQQPTGSDADRPLKLRKLLGHFIDVCEAIGYAHSRGVLHRDLKPGNIMLGKHGETLVVDWGLAKHLDDREGNADGEEFLTSTDDRHDNTPTMQGQAVGTPAFMSPEQAAGKLDDLSPASDIYSLGATLYMLLTGEPAFSGSLVQVLSQVKIGEFPRPRAKKKGVSKALEAVCLKAMATRPEDRYVSAEELAKELERWLADEPVGAYREPLSVRAKRWMGQHAKGAAATVASLVVGLFCLVLGFGILSQKNSQLLDSLEAEQEAREDAQAKTTMLVLKNEELELFIKAEEDAKRRSRRARAGAAVSLAQTKATADFFVSAFSKTKPGEPMTVGEALDAAVPRLKGRYLDQLEVRAEILRILGKIYLALEEPKKALPLLVEANTIQGDDFRVRSGKSEKALDTLYYLGVALQGSGEPRKAIRVLNQVIEVHEKFYPLDRLGAYRARMPLALAYLDVRDFPRYSELYDEAVLFYQRYYKSPPPKDPLTGGYLPNDEERLQRLDEVQPFVEHGIASLSKRLGENNPQTLVVRYHHVVILRARGEFARSIELAEDLLVDARRSDQLVRSIFHSMIGFTGQLYWSAGQPEKAILTFSQYVEHRLAKNNGLNLYDRFQLIILANMQIDAAQFEQGKATLERFLKISTNPELDKSNLYSYQIALARLHLEARQFAEAVPLLTKAVDYQRPIHQNDQTPLYDPMQDLANAHYLLGQFNEAGKYYQEYLAYTEKKAEEDTEENEKENANHLKALYLLALNLIRQGKLPEAATHIRKFEQFAAKTTLDEWQQARRSVLMGRFLIAQLEYEKGEPLLLQGYAAMRKRATNPPQVIEARMEETAAAIVQMYVDWGKPEQAQEWRDKLKTERGD